MLRMVPVDWLLHLNPKGAKRTTFSSATYLRTQNARYLNAWRNRIVESLLTQLADELLVTDITEPSLVLAALSDDKLQTAYDDVLEQFALELLIGAAKNSDWLDGKLVIDANHGPIHLLEAAFYAVRLEVRRRKLQQPGEFTSLT